MKLVEFDRSPLTTSRSSPAAATSASSRAAAATRRTSCAPGFPPHCDVLISDRGLRDHGRLPAMRNIMHSPCASAWKRRISTAPTSDNTRGDIPNDPELPLLLDKVYPCSRGGEDRLPDARLPAVRRRIWEALAALLAGKFHGFRTRN
jgi:NAD-reducing hydrogenase small subunit